jgi:hypothetical protein
VTYSVRRTEHLRPRLKFPDLLVQIQLCVRAGRGREPIFSLLCEVANLLKPRIGKTSREHASEPAGYFVRFNVRTSMAEECQT